MSPQVERTPPYLQVLGDLRRKIEGGELRPGDRLPSAQQLSETWGVSRPTAAKAITALAAEGLVELQPGVEARVIGPKSLSTGSDRFQRVRNSGSILRAGERSEGHQAAIVPASEEVAGALGVETGSDVVKRSRTFRDDSGIVALSTSWLAGELAELAPELLSDGPIPDGGTVGAVERATGRRGTRVRDTLHARLATAPEAKALGHKRPYPVQVAETVLWDENGEVIEYGYDVSGPGRNWSVETDLT